MSIATALQTLRDRQASIIEAINEKGVTLPSGSSLAACASAIGQIQTSGVPDLDYLDIQYTYTNEYWEVSHNFILKKLPFSGGSSERILYDYIGTHFRYNYKYIDPSALENNKGFLHYDNPYYVDAEGTPVLKVMEVSGSHIVPYKGIEYTYADFADDATLKISFNGNREQEENWLSHATSVYGIFDYRLGYKKYNGTGFTVLESDAVFDSDVEHMNYNLYTEGYADSNVPANYLTELRFPNLKLRYCIRRNGSSYSPVYLFGGKYYSGSQPKSGIRKISIPNLDILRPEGYTGFLIGDSCFQFLPNLQEVVVTNVRLDLIEELQRSLNYNHAGGSSDWILRNGSLIPNQS